MKFYYVSDLQTCRRIVSEGFPLEPEMVGPLLIDPYTADQQTEGNDKYIVEIDVAGMKKADYRRRAKTLKIKQPVIAAATLNRFKRRLLPKLIIRGVHVEGVDTGKKG